MRYEEKTCCFFLLEFKIAQYILRVVLKNAFVLLRVFKMRYQVPVLMDLLR